MVNYLLNNKYLSFRPAVFLSFVLIKLLRKIKIFVHLSYVEKATTNEKNFKFSGFGGIGSSFVDCEDDRLEKFENPPKSIWTLKGSYPMVYLCFLL